MKEEFFEFLEREIEKCKENEQKLIADSRKDEANLCRVEANIFDVIRTLYKVSDQQAGGNTEKACEMFLQKLAGVSKAWDSSYEQAKLHNDSAKILVEEAKRSAKDKALARFNELMKKEA